MASRGGRGRGGWRGGRSGGRGQAPGLKDDEGNYVAPEANAGPPPLFPEIELRQDPPEPNAHDKLLLLRRDDLIRYYKYSPYFIEPRPDKMAKASAAAAAGDTDDQERDRLARKSLAAQKPPLASLLTLHPHHFPEELYSDRERRLAARSTRDTEVFRRTPAAEDGEAAQELKKRLDKLNRQEQQRGGPDKEAAGGGAQKGAGEGEAADDDDANAAVGLDDDDDDVMEEDDYYQGEVYDDDDGYDDYDDAGDEGAVY